MYFQIVDLSFCGEGTSISEAFFQSLFKWFFQGGENVGNSPRDSRRKIHLTYM